MAQDPPVLADLVVNAVHEHERVDRVRGPGLPLPALWQDLVRDLADHLCGHLYPIEVLQLVMDVPGAHPPAVERDDFFFDSGDVPLVFGDEASARIHRSCPGAHRSGTRRTGS